jgi:segregation and condensation protein A
MDDITTNIPNNTEPISANNKVIDVLLKEDDITWQSILTELVRSEQMDAWDIDISLVSDKFMETIKTLEKMDFRISGKMVLASAILLKLKSKQFISQDLDNFDKLVNFVDELEDEFGDVVDELEYELMNNELLPDGSQKPELIPRTPQPRKRKVSIYDLVSALEKALEVKQRRPTKSDTFVKVEAPPKKVDLDQLIKEVKEMIIKLLNGKDSILFNELIPSQTKEDKVMTFIPCLHLDNMRHIALEQEQHFGEINISLRPDNVRIQEDIIKNQKKESQKTLS